MKHEAELESSNRNDEALRIVCLIKPESNACDLVVSRSFATSSVTDPRDRDSISCL